MVRMVINLIVEVYIPIFFGIPYYSNTITGVMTVANNKDLIDAQMTSKCRVEHQRQVRYR